MGRLRAVAQTLWRWSAPNPELVDERSHTKARIFLLFVTVITLCFLVLGVASLFVPALRVFQDRVITVLVWGPFCCAALRSARFVVAVRLCLLFGLALGFVQSLDMLAAAPVTPRFSTSHVSVLVPVTMCATLALPLPDILCIVVLGWMGTLAMPWLAPGRITLSDVSEILITASVVQSLSIGQYLLQRQYDAVIQRQTVDLAQARDLALHSAAAKTDFVAALTHEVRMGKERRGEGKGTLACRPFGGASDGRLCRFTDSAVRVCPRVCVDGRCGWMYRSGHRSMA